MGNSGSAAAIDASYGTTALATLTTPVTAIDARYCSPSPVKIQLKKIFLPNKLKFKDLGTGAVVFRTGGESDFVTRLLDGDKKTKMPIAVLKRQVRNTQAVHAASNNGVAGEKLFDVHFRLGESNTLWFEDTELVVDLIDKVTGESCQIVLDGDWRRHSVVFWLVRSSGSDTSAVAVVKEAVAKVTPKSSSKLNTKYVLEIVANVDTALLVLLCAAGGQAPHRPP